MRRAAETAQAEAGEAPFDVREWLGAVVVLAGVCACGAFILGLAYWLLIRH
jgi:hypothetical protein